MDATPGTVWVDAGLPHVRAFASADSESELTCRECGRPVGGEAFVTDLDGGTVTAAHERCLPEGERQEAEMAHRLSRLEKRLSSS